MTERTMDTPVTAFRNIKVLREMTEASEGELAMYGRSYIFAYEHEDYTQWEGPFDGYGEAGADDAGIDREALRRELGIAIPTPSTQNVS